MLENESAIQRACRLVGSQADMARALHVSPSMVNQLVKGARPIPAEYCPTIERKTCGKVRCEDLRPDVDWAYLRNSVNPPTSAGEVANA